MSPFWANFVGFWHQLAVFGLVRWSELLLFWLVGMRNWSVFCTHFLASFTSCWRLPSQLLFLTMNAVPHRESDIANCPFLHLGWYSISTVITKPFQFPTDMEIKIYRCGPRKPKQQRPHDSQRCCDLDADLERQFRPIYGALIPMYALLAH